MRVTKLFIAVGLLSGCVTALPLNADEGARAQLDGFECTIVRGDDGTAGTGDLVLFVCQIEDDGQPYGAHANWPQLPGDNLAPYNALLQLFTALGNTLQLAQSPQHGPVDTPKPTP